MTTIKELIERGTQALKSAGADEPEVHAELMAAFVCGSTRTYVCAFGSQGVTPRQEKLFNSVLKEKLSGRPLAHILGAADFLGRTYAVNPDVLIPRPETEELVQKAAELIKIKNPKILDLCCGSGCIGISLALIFPQAEVLCADISAAALQTAKKNAKNLKAANVKFIQSDLFDVIDDNFDLIISNPPYIPTAVIDTLSAEVRREPRLALDGGPLGLDVLERLSSCAHKYLNDGGFIALETGNGQPEKVVKFFKSEIWQQPATDKDMSGIERFVFVSKKQQRGYNG